MSLPTLDQDIDLGADRAHDLLTFDREHLWHPYTSMTDPAPVRLVTGAEGVRLHLSDHDGERLEVVDAMSSWWSAVHGYRVTFGHAESDIVELAKSTLAMVDAATDDAEPASLTG